MLYLGEGLNELGQVLRRSVVQAVPLQQVGLGFQPGQLQAEVRILTQGFPQSGIRFELQVLQRHHFGQSMALPVN